MVVPLKVILLYLLHPVERGGPLEGNIELRVQVISDVMDKLFEQS